MVGGRFFAGSGRSSAWLERYVRDVEVAGSNPVAPTFFRNMHFGENDEGLSHCGDKSCVIATAIQEDDFELFCEWTHWADVEPALSPFIAVLRSSEKRPNRQFQFRVACRFDVGRHPSEREVGHPKSEV